MVLVADVVVILMFTVAFSLAQASLGGATASAPEILVRLLREVVGSILAGALIGGVLTLYLRFVKRELVVFAVVLVFATAAAAQALHFELLLSLLVAGFLVENVAPVRAEPLVQTLHVMAVPVFVIFFAMAGAELRLQTFAALWPLVLAVALAPGGTGLRRRHGPAPAWVRAEPVVVALCLDRSGDPGRRCARPRHHRRGAAAAARHGDADHDRGDHRLQRVGRAGAVPARARSGGRDS